MRVLLKKKDKYCSIYFIKRQKRNNCIIGWFSQKSHIKAIFPELEVEDNEVHFTYHADGNYHISIKYQDAASNKIERRLFWDKIIIKNLTKNTCEIFTKDNATANERCFMLNYKPLPFCDKNLFFPTTSINFNLANEWLHRWFDDSTILGTVPREDDIIIDIDEKRDCSISASAALMGSDYEFTITNPDFAKTVREILVKEDKSKSPYIRLHVFLE